MDLQELQSAQAVARAEYDKLRTILNVDALTRELGVIETRAADPAFWSNPQEARSTGKRRAELESKLADVQAAGAALTDFEAFIELSVESPGFLEENAGEAGRLLEGARRRIETLRHDVYFTDPMSVNNAILSIHPGTGGVEAQDWADMILRMYTRWAGHAGLGVEMLDYQTAEEAGIKDATLLVSGRYAYGLLRCERGVHRLVRISPFDANHRRHTSFASVYVLPEIDEDITIEIRPEDLRVDTFRASGAGGQHVNKTDSAIRITHLTTGLVVSCQTERSQHKNRENAMRILRAKLYDLKEQEKQKELEKLGGAKDDIGWGRQIRSYVLEPYQLVKDHRTGHETSSVNAVLDGDLDAFIESFLSAAAQQ
ncbi:MAG: peptide chain release factor 2 [Candidatus Lindowbacteria bacterium RIFCSPLOWO2_12_FULL_62_27]|nr:MAG: peptide chain release factor 2 [Candidatus Lindowbacteria bacterium RIFCSPLOWO2_12_FULL_62_27]OGH63708.1 MAG: peptide chain release factor 2 [Candidatus Lindowbacteria bacterium RIFCSPLOWO2_02_FULL_62_12]